MIKHFDGDLIQNFKDNKYDGIAHGCNCFFAMNSGIAKTIREEFVDAYKADLASVYGSTYKLGLMTIASVDHGMIFNLYTQYKPGKQDDTEQLYANIKQACRNLNCWVRNFKKVNKIQEYLIGLPKIGAGIAGGEWDKILEIIETELTEPEVHIINFVPGHVDLFSLV